MTWLQRRVNCTNLTSQACSSQVLLLSVLVVPLHQLHLSRNIYCLIKSGCRVNHNLSNRFKFLPGHDGSVVVYFNAWFNICDFHVFILFLPGLIKSDSGHESSSPSPTHEASPPLRPPHRPAPHLSLKARPPCLWASLRPHVCLPHHPPTHHHMHHHMHPIWDLRFPSQHLTSWPRAWPLFPLQPQRTKASILPRCCRAALPSSRWGEVSRHWVSVVLQKCLKMLSY